MRGESREGNGFELSQRLEARGCRLSRTIVVPDDRAVIAEVLEQGRDALVFVSGGLGPTDDDFTREAVAEALGVPLRRDPLKLAELRERYAQAGRAYAESNDRQADLPEGCRWLSNPVGTAAGFMMTEVRATTEARVSPDPEGGSLVCLPGVPSEFRAMLDLHLDEVMRTAGLSAERVPETTFKIFGIPESEMQDRLKRLPSYARIRMRSLPAFPEIRLKISQLGSDSVGYAGALEEIRTDLRWRIFADREKDTHAGIALKAVRDAGLRLWIQEDWRVSGGFLLAWLVEAASSLGFETVLEGGGGGFSGGPASSVLVDDGARRLFLETQEGGRVVWRLHPGASGMKVFEFPSFRGRRQQELMAHSALLELRRVAGLAPQAP